MRFLGRLLSKLSTPTPLVSCHKNCWWVLTRSWRFWESVLKVHHCSISRALNLISSDLAVPNCKYICFKETVQFVEWNYFSVLHLKHTNVNIYRPADFPVQAVKYMHHVKYKTTSLSSGIIYKAVCVLSRVQTAVLPKKEKRKETSLTHCAMIILVQFVKFWYE